MVHKSHSFVEADECGVAQQIRLSPEQHGNPVSAAPFCPDTTESLALLGAHGVRYRIVGGEAVICCGHARPHVRTA